MQHRRLSLNETREPVAGHYTREHERAVPRRAGPFNRAEVTSTPAQARRAESLRGDFDARHLPRVLPYRCFFVFSVSFLFLLLL